MNASINSHEKEKKVQQMPNLVSLIIPGLRPTPAAVQRNPDALQPILYDPHFSPC
jgi:hypothetical protein